jgi:predicted permease
MLRRLRLIVDAVLHRDRFEREMADEMNFHVQAYADDLMRSGMPRAEAVRRARMEFGGVEVAREDCRQARGLQLYDQVRQDVRYAARQMRRSPGFAAAAVLSLALAIGANTAVFSVVDGVLLRSLPVARPHELVVLDAITPRGEVQNLSYRRFEWLREQQAIFGAVFAAQDGFRREGVIRPGSGQVEEARVQLVSGEYFQSLGVRSQVGRLFTPEDSEVPLGHPVAVVSDAYWRARLSADPAVVGRPLRIGEYAVTIVGVAPRGFFGHEVERAPEIWLPLMMQPALDGGASYLANPRVGWLRVMARLAPISTREGAEAAINTALSRDEPSAASRGRIAVAEGRRGLPEFRKGASFSLGVLAAIAVTVLLIACANVANLLLARAAARRREVAIRVSVGAGRRRLLRQFLTEGALLGGVGGVAGLVLAWWGSRLLVVFLSSDGSLIPLDLTPDTRLLTFALALTAITVIASSLAPALSVTRDGSARPDTVEGVRWRFTPAFVITEVALSLLVVAGAALFLQTLRNMRMHDLGFSADGLVQFEVMKNHRPPSVDETGRILERLSSLPELGGVTLAHAAFGTGMSRTCCVAVEGHVHAEGEEREIGTIGVVPGYFQTVQLPLRGRDFALYEATRNPRELPRVAVVNEEFVRRYLDGRDPIGRRFGWGDKDVSFDIEIVGVARNTYFENLRERPRALMYFPSHAGEYYLARARGSGDAAAAAIARSVRAFDDETVVVGLSTIGGLVERTFRRERMLATLSSGFALIAAALAAIGLYGLMSWAVTARSREIGIRMALGASRLTVVVDELKRAARLASIGILAGVPMALAAGQFIRSHVFGVSVTDPLTLAAAAGVLLLVALAAAVLPARRAFAVDPMIAIRTD